MLSRLRRGEGLPCLQIRYTIAYLEEIVIIIIRIIYKLQGRIVNMQSK